MLRSRISDSLGGVAVFLGWCAARLVGVQLAAKCVTGRAACRVAWLVVARAFQGWLLPCLLFTGGSGGTALSGWLLMELKITRTPRTLRGKPSLDAIGAKRERKQPALPLKDQTGARGRGAQQSTPVMEKTTRTEALETEVKAAATQTATQGQQISDIQWKLEDAEKRA
ncbi:hypothetical protein NDU88_005061 [Pleurodeles waltl]|uniref:Uncharacterized protein n=1 Tax=Pleurodeles waltl TaxID=8319 RepID=A0AAV7SKN1_PLEWA|nr:hypothetical protein NDU88_005061 [Pleurodeles waltl]